MSACVNCGEDGARADGLCDDCAAEVRQHKGYRDRQHKGYPNRSR